jgi:hypothetical protein
MADFARWVAACETAFWPPGTFAGAYAVNRRAAVENIIDGDPVAICVRTIMGEQSSWTGTASDLLRLCAQSAREDLSLSPAWAKNPRVLAGRLRRAQTFLRLLGVEIAFGREGRSGARVIRLNAGRRAAPGPSISIGKRGRMVGTRMGSIGIVILVSIVSPAQAIRPRKRKHRAAKFMGQTMPDGADEEALFP